MLPALVRSLQFPWEQRPDKAEKERSCGMKRRMLLLVTVALAVTAFGVGGASAQGEDWATLSRAPTAWTALTEAQAPRLAPAGGWGGVEDSGGAETNASTLCLLGCFAQQAACTLGCLALPPPLDAACAVLCYLANQACVADCQ